MNPKSDNFEKDLAKLQKIVSQLESEDLPLEKGLELYKQGLSLSKACRERLDKAKLAIKLVGEDGLEDFNPEPADLEDDEAGQDHAR